MQSLRTDHRKIIIAKSMTPVGREIGFLRGDMHDKVVPWLGAFFDNFIELGIQPEKVEEMMEEAVLEITPITFIQGRSLTNSVLIVDEAQNLDIGILKQIITRAGQNTRIILLGDSEQIFEKMMHNSLELLLERSLCTDLVGSVTLKESVRSPLSAWAVENL